MLLARTENTFISIDAQQVRLLGKVLLLFVRCVCGGNRQIRAPLPQVASIRSQQIWSQTGTCSSAAMITRCVPSCPGSIGPGVIYLDDANQIGRGARALAPEDVLRQAHATSLAGIFSQIGQAGCVVLPVRLELSLRLAFAEN